MFEELFEELTGLAPVGIRNGSFKISRGKDSHPDLDYDIPIKRCDTPEKLLAWQIQLMSKTWVDIRLLKYFTEFVCDHFGWSKWC